MAVGADGWPEFSIPDVGNDEGTAFVDSDVNNDTSSTARADDKSGPASTTPGNTTPAGKTGTQGGEQGPNPGDGFIPKYRFDEVNEKYSTLERNFQALQDRILKMLESQAAPKTPEKPAAPPLEPEEQARRDRLFAELRELNPTMARAIALAEKSDQIEKMLARFDQLDQAETLRQQQEAQRHEAFAKQQLDTLFTGYAQMFGKDKTGKDLPDDLKGTLKDNFVRWLLTDPTRSARYDAGDTKLPGEFVQAWRAQFVDPSRRSTAAGQMREAKRRERLPESGGTANPLGTPPAKPKDDEDEDAIFHRAFAHSRALQDQLG